ADHLLVALLDGNEQRRRTPSAWVIRARPLIQEEPCERKVTRPCRPAKRSIQRAVAGGIKRKIQAIAIFAQEQRDKVEMPAEQGALQRPLHPSLVRRVRVVRQEDLDHLPAPLPRGNLDRPVPVNVPTRTLPYAATEEHAHDLGVAMGNSGCENPQFLHVGHVGMAF
ncbi:hypothetical protein COL922a_014351, partial [Colletotrichum nupharicola]